MNEHFTYGTEEDNFEKLKKIIGNSFDVPMEEHESGWWGIYALAKSQEFEQIKLYPNFVEGEGHHNRDHELKYLLDISFPSGSINLANIIKEIPVNFKLVKHSEV